MGIIKAVANAAGGVSRDQFKEFFMCDAIPDDTMMVRGIRSGSYNDGDPNVITDGSVIVIADGQSVITVSQGKVTDVCTEPGTHVFASKYSKNLFSKGGVTSQIKEAGRRFTFGGDVPAQVERIYYVNMKIIPGGRFTNVSIPFHFEDANTGADIDCIITCSGNYSFKVVDPAKFYKMVTGNVYGSYKTSTVLRMMDSEFATMLNTYFARLNEAGKRSYELPSLIPQLGKIISEGCTEMWREQRGIEMVSFMCTDMNVNQCDRATVSSLQKAKVLSDPKMAAAYMTVSTADAVRKVADNKRFPGVITAGNQRIVNWKCSCGQFNKGNFCTACGQPKP